MFTIVKEIGFKRSGKSLVNAVCLSADDKPLSFTNGSTAIEIDTGKIYAFDEDGGVWHEWEWEKPE